MSAQKNGSPLRHRPRSHQHLHHAQLSPVLDLHCRFKGSSQIAIFDVRHR